MDDFRSCVAAVARGVPLTATEARAAFGLILEGCATPAQLGAFLMGLRMRGETVDEIIGATEAMRAAMVPVVAPPDAIDIVGTGGDGAGTYNVSTLAAIIAGACGAPVAKHGGKAASSRSGASDVLGALGVRVGGGPATAALCLRDVGLCFMAGPTHHPALRHAGPVRAELGVRTIFNLLGPLCNPARVDRQVIGVYSRDWLEPLARALRTLGARRVWLLHGADGLDEATTTTITHVAALESGQIRLFDIAPEDADLPRAPAEALTGGDPKHNAAAMRAVLTGAKNAYRDIAVLNAAIALVVAERVSDLREGAREAQMALDSGAAAAKLDALIAATNRDG
jgi:anthranilate phosphoribosyltransferase